MSYSTTVSVEADDKLSKWEYRYWLRDNLRMELDWIIQWARPTRRHAYRNTKSWSRLNIRESNMPRFEPPASVKDEVRKRINETLAFC